MSSQLKLALALAGLAAVGTVAVVGLRMRPQPQPVAEVPPVQVQPKAGKGAPPPPPPDAQPVAMQRAPATMLLRAAEAARDAGDYEQAAAALFVLLRNFPNDDNVPMAALMLGTLELEHLGKPLEAGRHFALAAKSPALTSQARLKQVEALVASGDVRAAETAARAVIQAAPQSEQASRLQKWLDDPQHSPALLR